MCRAQDCNVRIFEEVSFAVIVMFAEPLTVYCIWSGLLSLYLLCVNILMILKVHLEICCRVELSICSDLYSNSYCISSHCNFGIRVVADHIQHCTLGMLLSIMTFDESNSVWSAVKLFPARSKAVILNNTSPSTLF